MTRVGCGVLGGTGVCHPVIHGRGGNERHRAEGTGKGLWAPLPEPRCQGWQLLWQSSRERQGRQRRRERMSRLLHRRVVPRCSKEGMRHRPVTPKSLS
jgi:hypothetical protein